MAITTSLQDMPKRQTARILRSIRELVRLFDSGEYKYEDISEIRVWAYNPVIENNKIQFNCKHIESEDCITQMPFSIDLKDYFESNTKEMKKIMFFVNNFKRLTLNAQ